MGSLSVLGNCRVLGHARVLGPPMVLGPHWVLGPYRVLGRVFLVCPLNMSLKEIFFELFEVMYCRLVISRDYTTQKHELCISFQVL